MNSGRWTASEKWRAKRKAEGGCISCTQPAEPGNLRCAFHRAKSRTASRNRDERVRGTARAICNGCGADRESGEACMFCGPSMPREYGDFY